MALKDLTPQQMMHVTGAWLDSKRERPLLAGCKRVAPLLEDIDEAHEGVRKAHRKEKREATELSQIQARQLEVDRIHDRKARGGWNVLTGFADLADDPETAAFYLDLRSAMYPNGLKFITGSYADEAGEVQLARERLSLERKAALKALPTPSGSLLKAIQAWFAAGQELGELEARRAQLVAESRAQQQDDEKPQGNQLRARNQWIRTVRGVLQMLEMEKLDPETERRVLAPLQHELERAERRQAGEPEPEEPSTDAEPTPAEGS